MRRHRWLIALALVAVVCVGSTARRWPIVAVADPFTPSLLFEDFEQSINDDCPEEDTILSISGTVPTSQSTLCTAAGLAGSESAEWSESRTAAASDTGDMRTDPALVANQTTGVVQFRFLFRIDTMGSLTTTQQFIRGYLDGSQNGIRVYFNPGENLLSIGCDAGGGSEVGSALVASTTYYVLGVYDIDLAVGTLYVNTGGYSKTNVHSTCDGVDGSSGMDAFRFYRAFIDTYRIDDFAWGPDA